jgi:hypothetical protein
MVAISRLSLSTSLVLLAVAPPAGSTGTADGQSAFSGGSTDPSVGDRSGVIADVPGGTTPVFVMPEHMPVPVQGSWPLPFRHWGA